MKFPHALRELAKECSTHFSRNESLMIKFSRIISRDFRDMAMSDIEWCVHACVGRRFFGCDENFKLNSAVGKNLTEFK